MARSVDIEARLLRWAEWRKVGDGSGYSTINPLHPNWSPPAPGVRPAPRQSRAHDALETDRAVRQLSQRLQETLDLVYCRNLSRAEQAARLECAESTVSQRVQGAHRQLRQLLDEAAAQKSAAGVLRQ